MICILGDIHFNSSKNFYRDICESFLSWFESWEYNNGDNTLILAGDLVESASNAGIVIDWLNRFVDSSRFKHIHICVGNHDKKIISDIQQLAYEFYKGRSNITIYETAASAIIENAHVLFLPYFTGVGENNLTMHDYYSNISKDSRFAGHYDFVVGHVGAPDALFEGSNDCISNLDKVDTDRVCCGHIHTRASNPDRYIGSVYACKKSENDDTRSAWLFDPTTKEWSEDPLPIFAEFLTTVYPDELPVSRALHPVYTILSCASEKLAIERYGKIHIRKVVSADYDTTLRNSVEEPTSTTRAMSTRELFEEFVKSQSTPIDNMIIQKCRSILETKAS